MKVGRHPRQFGNVGILAVAGVPEQQSEAALTAQLRRHG